MLDKERKYFNSHKAELLEKFSDRFVVIVGEKVIGDYGTEIEAYTAALENYELGTFFIGECTNKNDQPQIFHTRVSFV